MKLFLVVLLAGVWSTAVTAAPQSTPNFSFQEYGLDFPNFVEFDQNSEDLFHCIRMTIVRVFEESKLGPVYDDSKNKINNLVNVEWPKCVKTTNPFEKVKCHANVIKSVADAVNVFVKQLTETNKMELVTQMKDKIIGFCFKSNTNTFEMDYGFDYEIEQLASAGKFLPRFECVADALDKVSKAHNLQSLWKKSQPKLVQHLSKWRKCQNSKNPVFRYICEVKEGVSSFVVVMDYVKLASAQDPEFPKYFGAYYKENCQEKSFSDLEVTEPLADDEFAVVDANAYLARFECVAQSLDKVTQRHNLQSLWKAPKERLTYHLTKWKSCKKTSNPALVLVCQVKAGVSSFLIITDYIKLASAQDSTFAQDFASEYKQNCGQSYFDELADLFVVDGVDACVQKLVQKIKCVSEATSESVHGTDFQAVWAEAEHELEPFQNQLNGCIKHTSVEETAKCIVEQLKGSYTVFAKFLSNLRVANYDAYNKLKENIKKKCYA